jgi:hypothetical protein
MGGCDKRTWGRLAEESAILEAVTRERLVTTKQAGKGLAGGGVICNEWSINPRSNTKPVYSNRKHVSGLLLFL